MVFYRKYRPQKFKDLIGQEVVSKTLIDQLESGKIAHGYLFFGSRGTGKTSAARIFAKAVNCEVYKDKKAQSSKLKTQKFGEPCGKCESCVSIAAGTSLDILEIDAASNRGIDEIRDLREKVKLSPVSARFKVYIIDEAHMLTNEAFNALLKTLEEPPAHVIFILATTEISKLPQTIMSRLMKFNFKRAKDKDIYSIISKIAKEEGIKIEKESIEAIAEAADGSYRDAESILDQVSVSKKEIKKQDVLAVSKVSGKNIIFSFLKSLAKKDVKKAVLGVEQIYESGADMSYFAKNIILTLEKILFLKIGLRSEAVDDLNDGNVEEMNSIVLEFSSDEVQRLMGLFLVAESEIKLYPLPSIPIVLVCVKFCGTEEGVNESKESEESIGVKGQSLSEDEAQEKNLILNKTEDSVSKSKTDSGDLVDVKKTRKATKSLSEVEKNWGEFLNRVRVVNAHVVALLRSARPVEFDGSSLTLEVFYRFHKEKLEEPKIVKMLDGKFEEVMNTPIKFHFVLARRESTPTKEVIKSDVVDIKSDDLEKIAQEIFSK